jgi:hypothetical protein
MEKFGVLHGVRLNLAHASNAWANGIDALQEKFPGLWTFGNPNFDLEYAELEKLRLAFYKAKLAFLYQSAATNPDHIIVDNLVCELIEIQNIINNFPKPQ